MQPVPQQSNAAVLQPSRIRKRWLLFCAALVGLFCLFWYFKPYFFAFDAIHELERDHRNLALMPQFRKLGSPAATVDSILFSGHRLTLPWKAELKDHHGAIGLKTSYKGGRTAFILDDGAMDPIQRNMMQVWNSIGGKSYGNSSFDYFNQILGVSPNDIRLFTRRGHAAVASTALVMKSVELRDDVTAIYRLDIAPWRGFQIGDPATSKIIMIRLFDPNDHSFQIVLNRLGEPITQEEIDCILYSIKNRHS